jgi:predicted phosphate transport protein (TIGR00153 family)
MKKVEDTELKKLSIDELTQLFMDNINEQNLKLIEGIEFLVQEDFDKFKANMSYVIDTNTEVQIKKKFESKIFKSKLMFSKADRLKLFTKINDIKNIGEFLANKMLLYKAVFPDEQFKSHILSILKSLKIISNNLSNAVKSIGSDLSRAHDICEEIKDERRKMRNEEWQLLNRLYNYDMDYLSRTFIYLKELIEGIMMLADHIKNFSEYIQFLATKYLIFD